MLVGGGLALSGAYGTLAVINAANIPELAASTSGGLGSAATGESNAVEFRIDYALTR